MASRGPILGELNERTTLSASSFEVLPPWEPTHNPPLSPLDGRYRAAASPLAGWLSEDALNRARLYVEVCWVQFVLDERIIPSLPPLSADEREYLFRLPLNFGDAERRCLAEIEAETRHDVKAVEYLMRERMKAGGSRLSNMIELAHFLCTSEDINNLAYALCIKGAMNQAWIPAARLLIQDLDQKAKNDADAGMLSRTHGQPATPTTMGKEIAVFHHRLSRQLALIEKAPIHGKMNGATGTYSAHVAVLPRADWLALSRKFVESLGLQWSPLTTQIEPHDWQVNLYSLLSHFNRIGHNLATDVWQYISMGYFAQQSEGGVGSSTMPHKVNPIRFENAEANFEMSNAVLGALIDGLSTTRLQRDLSDSSLQRNIGVALGYSLVSMDNLHGGLSRITVDRDRLQADLGEHPEILSEAIQQALRLELLVASVAASPENSGSSSEPTTAIEPYEALKQLTRGRQVTLQDLRDLIDSSALSPQLRDQLRDLTPATYLGLAEQLAVLRE